MNKKSTVLRIVALALVFVLTLGVMSTALAESATGTTISNVNLRSAPLKSASIIATLGSSTSVTLVSLVKKGTTVDGKTADDDWYKVITASGEGYISAAFISVASSTVTPTPSAVVQTSDGTLNNFTGETITINNQRYQKAYITASNVSLRQSASNSSARIATMAKNTGVALIGVAPDFYKIIYNGKTGYVAKEYVRLTAAVIANTAAPNVAAAPAAGWTPVADAPAANLSASEAKFWSTVPALYNEYKSANGDTAGYLAIPNTNVRYPVMFSGSDYYLNHGIHKNSDSAGLPYIHKNYKDPNQRRHIVVAGHNLGKSGRMFNHLNDYKSLSFYQNNPIIRFDLYGVPGEWQVFSDHISKPDSKYIRMAFSSDADWLTYINWLKTESDHYGKVSDVTLRANDSVLTLYTCTYESWLGVKGRYFVHFRRVR